MTRKLILITLAAALLTIYASAQGSGFNSYQGPTSFSTTGPAQTIYQNSLIKYHQLVWFTTGTVSTCQVALDSSVDGVSWSAGGVITAQTCTSNGSSSITGVVSSNYIRVNVTTLSGGGSVGVIYEGWAYSPTGSISGTSSITGGDFYTLGPDPWVDVVAFGAKGDALAFNSMGASGGSTITIAGSSTSKFAATDCVTGGTGCTGTVNKYLGISAGGLNAPASVPALTAAAGGSQLANFLAFKIACTQDNGTILNGESAPSAESVIAVTANQKVTTALAPTCPANTNGAANGYRVYLIDPTAVYETSVTAGGTGYTSPSMTFNGGTCTTTPVTALITAGYGASGGYVVGANITTPGACTVNPTSCTISGGGGASATATCTYTGGVLTKVTINNNGSGFTLPTIAVTGNGVTGLTAGPMITGGAGVANAGTLTGVQIMNPGWLNGAFPSATPTGAVSGGGASVQGTFNFQFGGEMLQPSTICSASTGIHPGLNICDITATINLTVAPSYLLGVYPPLQAAWLTTINQFNSTSSVGIADALPNPGALSGNAMTGFNGTDNTTALTNALASCWALNNIKNNPGCTVFFPGTDPTTGSAVPNGRYFFKAGLNISQPNIYLRGVGSGTSPNGGNQPLGSAVIGQTNTFSRSWTGGKPPSEIVVGSRDWAIHWTGSPTVQGGGASQIGVEDLIGQSPGGFFLDGNSNVGINLDHFVLFDTNAINFTNGNCYTANSAQIFWLYNPQGNCRNGIRYLDQVSNPQMIGGALVGSQAVGSPSQGPSYCIWETANPNSLTAPGNGQYVMPECRDFSSGWFFSYDHGADQIVIPKYENIAMAFGEACINQQACMGIGLRYDSFQGSTLNRCSGNIHISGQFSRINQTWYNGHNCINNEIDFPNGVPPVGNGDVVYVDNGTKSDILSGNGWVGSIAGQWNGGLAFVPEAMANNSTTVDCTKGNWHQMTYTSSGGTLTMANPTGCLNGQQLIFQITNGSGASTESIAWGTNYTNGFATLSAIPTPQVCMVVGHFDSTSGHVMMDTPGTMSTANNCH